MSTRAPNPPASPSSASHGAEPTTGPLTFEELQLATRNRGMPLEAMRSDITPTGLHYLLVHFDIPFVDPATWRLRIGGKVARSLDLTLEDIRARPRDSQVVTMECAGNGRARLRPRPLSQPWLHEAIGTAKWTGTPLAPLLAEAGLSPDTVDIVFTGADRGVQGEEEHDYARALKPADALRPEVLLAYEMNGEPLQPQHGFPLRLLVPGWYGMTSVKWLTSIGAIGEVFDGFQQARAYRFTQGPDDEGEPVTRMRPRALMIPPGIPEFFTRHRLVDRGPVEIRGRAWSGTNAVARVEVGIDGVFVPAILHEPIGLFAWRAWSCVWDATRGDHELTCRATTSAGETQPIEQPWNYQGLASNHVQTVAVTVR